MDYFEIDFLDVESQKSGDAIAIRYSKDGDTFIHVVDGGFQETGKKLVNHIRTHYENPKIINHVVVTHPDGDHAGGLRSVLEEFDVGTLWMLRPWKFSSELLPRFDRFTSETSLKKRLKEIYPNIAALGEIAIAKGIPIMDPFQGSKIGEFFVLAPSRQRYLDLVVCSERTPESSEQRAKEESFADAFKGLVEQAINYIAAAWGAETFSPEETSAENEMSVVQFGQLGEEKILLTADAGRVALNEAADYAPNVGLTLPGIDRIQIPHHGSRRNVSTEILDRWLGEKRAQRSEETSFSAFVSASKADKHHPRKSVVRAFIHRGGRVISTQGTDIRSGFNAPTRKGWGPVEPLPYPEDQEA